VNEFLIDNQDFVYLIAGMSFFILALMAGSMVRKRGNNVDWRYLCAFGVLQGLSEWSDMLLPALGAERWLILLRGILLGGAFLCLFEFGRRSFISRWKWGTDLWIYLPWLLLILLSVQVEPEGLLAIIRLILGVPAGVLAALALWQAGVLYHDERRWIGNLLGLFAFGLYLVSSCLIVPSAHFWLASHFNEAWFWAHTGVPIQVLRSLMVGIVTLVLWRNYSQWRAHTYPADYIRRIKYVRWISVIAVSLVVVMGWFLVERAEMECRAEHERRLLSLSCGMASVINPQEVRELNGNRSDLQSPSYRDLKMQCQRICEADPFIRYVYMMAIREGKVVFLMDVEPERFKTEIDKPNAAPGEVYENFPPEIMDVFRTRNAIISKPYSDAWGFFISGYSPVLDSNENVIAVLGIDAKGQQWLSDIAIARLLRLLLTAVGIVLVLTLAVLWRREMEESQIRNANGKRMQLQQSALLRIANSSFITDGNIFMMARAVTSVTAEVIGVDRVELWLKLKNDEKFRAEDIFQSGMGTHTSGQFSCVAENDSFMELLREGRVALSSNFQEDERFGIIREELGQKVRAVLVSPLRVSGGLAGWLIAVQTSSCRNWLTDEMRFIAEMTDQVVHCLINNERRLAEDAQRKAHDELEMRVRERTEALSHKNDELSREINERRRMEKEQRMLQDKMQQAQKLESLGLMAGGIAHDFNNILMAVLGNVELARLETPEGSPVFEYLKDIDKASCRAAELARQMLIYSGRGHASIQGVDLNEMVKDMTSILKVSLGKRIHLDYDLEQELPLVDGDLTQIRQVLMNLVINAAEAIGKDNGTITLRTGVIQYDKAMFMALWLKEDLPEGKYVFMDVIDTGSGMDETTLKRIFDPFFTTKFTGRGLGLAAVLGIIKGHSGTIDVASQIGKGTRFRIILPLGRRAVCNGKSAPSEVALDWKGEGIILLVDDEATIRDLGRRMLERLGFSVLEANDGNEAIELFKMHSSRIRCVMLDMTMPDLNGKEVFNGIRQIDPVAKVVLCSGYIEENMADHFPDWKVSGFLQKPYKLETLITLLRSVLNG